MEAIKPLILITNDDGVDAKGIRVLADAIRPLGEIVVFAPDGPRSGSSGAITSHIPLKVNLIRQEEGLRVFSCTGTPVDCVKLAVNEILERKPDLVISGINHGSNTTICILYSGTLGAALEGCVFGIPSFGISLNSHLPDADFSVAASYACKIASRVLADGLPKGICLNVNVPSGIPVKGLKICTQAEGRWTAEFMKSYNPSGKEVYWLTGSFDNYNPEDTCTDEWAVTNGYVAVVPSKIDMTAYDYMETIKNWEAG